MIKPFKLGFIIGRFQHLHLGHMKIIDAGLATCDRLLLLVGSSQESGTERNPFNLKTRMDVIREVYTSEVMDGKLLLGHIDDMTNENDISADWGRFVLKKVDMWSQHYGLSRKMDCMIFGNDEERLSWFDPKDIEGVSQIVVARPDEALSASKMRKYLATEDFKSWLDNAPSNISNDYWFDHLRGELLSIPFYKELAKNEQN